MAIVLGTLLLLVGLVVGVVGAAMHRLSVAQREADASWHRPQAAHVQEINPSTAAIPTADEEKPAAPTFDSIELWPRDATLHGSVQCAELKSGKWKHENFIQREGKAAERLRMREAMGGQPISSYLTGFRSEADYAEWEVDFPRGATYEVSLVYACPSSSADKPFVLELDGKRIEIQTESTRSEGNFRVFTIGKAQLGAGRQKVSIRPQPSSARSQCFMNLRNVQLIPAPERP